LPIFPTWPTPAFSAGLAIRQWHPGRKYLQYRRTLQPPGKFIKEIPGIVGPRVRFIPDKMKPELIEEFNILEGELPTGRSRHEAP
jgi:hypothetical protein